MRLKLIFKGNKAYLATEQGDIIENATVLENTTVHEINDMSGVSIIKKYTVLDVQLNEIMPNYIESTIIEVPQ